MVRDGDVEGDKNSRGKAEMASHLQRRLREENHHMFGAKAGIRGWEKLL